MRTQRNQNTRRRTTTRKPTHNHVKTNAPCETHQRLRSRFVRSRRSARKHGVTRTISCKRVADTSTRRARKSVKRRSADATYFGRRKQANDLLGSKLKGGSNSLGRSSSGSMSSSLSTKEMIDVVNEHLKSTLGFKTLKD